MPDSTFQPPVRSIETVLVRRNLLAGPTLERAHRLEGRCCMDLDPG
jgi:hypothetical protein